MDCNTARNKEIYGEIENRGCGLDDDNNNDNNNNAIVFNNCFNI